MNIEEKRELRLQISQLLADAGLNQGVIKEMVETEIKNKVSRVIEQVIQNLNAQTSDGDYIRSEVKRWMNSSYTNSYSFTNAVKEELKNRAIKIVLTDVEGLKNG